MYKDAQRHSYGIMIAIVVSLIVTWFISQNNSSAPKAQNKPADVEQVVQTDTAFGQTDTKANAQDELGTNQVSDNDTM